MAAGRRVDGPIGCDISLGSVLAYLPVGTNEAVLVNPPVRTLPAGGSTRMVLQKASNDDYDYEVDWVELH